MFPATVCDPVEKPAMLRRRESLWEESERRCHWCKCTTVLTSNLVPHQATIDHVIPRGRGGSDLRGNLVSACLNCNRRRNHEDNLGLPDGALLKLEAPAQPPIGSYPGEVKKLVPYRPATNALDVVKLQRDQALKELGVQRQEVIHLRQMYAAAMATVQEAEQRRTNMTFRKLLAMKLKQWAENLLQ